MSTDREALAACAAAIPLLVRCLFPVELVMAQQATTDEPYGDDDCALYFMGSGGSDRVTFGEVRAALTAAGNALEVSEQLLQQPVDDVTWWMTVADGVTHDPRCAPDSPCQRCRLEACERKLQRMRGRVVPPDWHGPAEDF